MREIEMSSKVQETVKLLRDDNLIWSSDFDLVRHKIADVIEEANTITHPVIMATIRDLCHTISSPVLLENLFLEKPNA
jgi:hypothetical protein